MNKRKRRRRLLRLKGKFNFLKLIVFIVIVSVLGYGFMKLYRKNQDRMVSSYQKIYQEGLKEKAERKKQEEEEAKRKKNAKKKSAKKDETEKNNVVKSEAEINILVLNPTGYEDAEVLWKERLNDEGYDNVEAAEIDLDEIEDVTVAYINEGVDIGDVLDIFEDVEVYFEDLNSYESYNGYEIPEGIDVFVILGTNDANNIMS